MHCDNEKAGVEVDGTFDKERLWKAPECRPFAMIMMMMGYRVELAHRQNRPGCGSDRW